MEASYKIWFDANNIYLENTYGKVGHLPLKEYESLLYASDEERNQYNFSPFGIHWAKLDEDLCFDGFNWEKQ